MTLFEAPVLENRELAEGYYELTLAWPAAVRAPRPGQIVSLRVESSSVLFLRRPFALAGFDRGSGRASLIYHVRGPATRRMALWRAGDHVDTLGPRGFFFQAPASGRPLLVGGGVGTGPLLFAARWLAARGRRPLLLLGYRSAKVAPSVDAGPGVETVVCTEDGTRGETGTVLDWLTSRPAGTWDGHFVWACGPNPMLRALHFWSQGLGLPCQVSLEEVMACGVGACLGCTVETTDGRGTVRLCTEGPVLPSEVIRWT